MLLYCQCDKRRFEDVATFCLLSILSLDIMDIATIMPVLLTSLNELTVADVGEAAFDGGWLLLVYAAIKFLFAALIGNPSDRFQRRPVLLASVLTFAINPLPTIATGCFHLAHPRWHSGESFGTASAYIADI